MTPSIHAAAQTADFSQDTWWIWMLKAVFILVFLILNVILALWVERRALARMQTRLGPTGSARSASGRPSPTPSSS